jgi:hypothetical protein
MKQSMLWIPECAKRGTDVWARLTEESRADLVGQLVRLVVESFVSVGKPAKRERGNRGVKSSSTTPEW